MGTPEAIRQRGPVIGTSAELSSSSSQGEHSKAGAPKSTEHNPGEHVDLSVSPTESTDVTMTTSAAPVIKCFKEIKIASVHKQNKATKDSEGMAGTSEQPPPPKLITLSNLGNRKEDTMGKRTRSLGTAANEPAHKKPSQNSLASDPKSEPSREELLAIRTRNQDREKEIDDEVKRSCQNIQWTRMWATPQEHRSLVLRLEKCRHYPASESCCCIENDGAQMEKCSRERLLFVL
jgi:hypothetical protein